MLPDGQCLKVIVSYILSGPLVGSGGRVNLFPITPSWLEVKVSKIEQFVHLECIH